jgi:hypothetical protein
MIVGDRERKEQAAQRDRRCTGRGRAGVFSALKGLTMLLAVISLCGVGRAWGEQQIYQETQVVDPDDASTIYAIGADTEKNTSWGSLQVWEGMEASYYEDQGRRGIYVSRDGGSTWKLHEDDKILRLLTFSQNIYRSTDSRTVAAGTIETTKSSTKTDSKWTDLRAPLPTRLSIVNRDGKKYLIGHGPRSIWVGENMKKWRKYRIDASFPDPANPKWAYAAVTGGKPVPGLLKPIWTLTSVCVCLMSMVSNSEQATGSVDQHNQMWVGLARIEDGTWITDIKRLKKGAAGQIPKVTRSRVHTFLPDPGNPDLIYALSGDAVHRSNDHGEKWKKAISGRITSVGVDQTTPNVLYVVKDWQIHVSQDAGSHMKKTTPKPEGGKGRALLVFPHANGVALVGHLMQGNMLTGSKATKSLAWSSNDQGRTWETVAELPVVNTWENDAANGVAYLATEGGIYAVQGDYRTWEPVREAGSGAFYTVGQHSETGCVYVGGESGLIKTCNNGTSWDRLSSETSPGEGKIPTFEFAYVEGVSVLKVEQPGFFRSKSWLLHDTGEGSTWKSSSGWGELFD